MALSEDTQGMLLSPLTPTNPLDKQGPQVFSVFEHDWRFKVAQLGAAEQLILLSTDTVTERSWTIWSVLEPVLEKERALSKIAFKSFEDTRAGFVT
jgi:hypothetical protein